MPLGQSGVDGIVADQGEKLSARRQPPAAEPEGALAVHLVDKFPGRLPVERKHRRTGVAAPRQPRQAVMDRAGSGLKTLGGNPATRQEFGILPAAGALNPSSGLIEATGLIGVQQQIHSFSPPGLKSIPLPF